MHIDFSRIDNSVINNMALTLAVFLFGTALIAGIVARTLIKFRLPMFILKPLIAVTVLSSLYYGATYFR